MWQKVLKGGLLHKSFWIQQYGQSFWTFVWMGTTEAEWEPEQWNLVKRKLGAIAKQAW